MTNKKGEPTNPNGKKGCKEHQDKIEEEARKIEKSDLEAITEYKLEFPDGSKNYIDVAGLDEIGNPVKLVQVGIQNKNGTPVAREQRLIDKVLNFFGIKINFVAYKTTGDSNKP